jgi:protease-4
MIQDQGIPVIASYGDVAASGGYYISCHADSIFAEPNTITGSIGVYSMVPNAKELLSEKLGVHFDSVKTHKYAGSFNPMMDWSRDQTDNMYKVFLSIVAEGRDMSVEEVHKIAQGRVWSGKRAVENGLVDKLGGLDDAIAAASKMADISEYRIREYPAVSDPITQLMEKFTKKSNIKSAIVKETLGDYAQIYEYLELIKAFDEPMALMPLRHSIN